MVNRWIESFSEEDQQLILWNWDIWARDKQLTPEPLTAEGIPWVTWLILAGRGFGKTRTGAEFIRDEVHSKRMRKVALIAPTAADGRDVMVEGTSGILSVCPPWDMPIYEPSKRRLTWRNGATATVYSADEPERLRGPEHDGFWADEVAAWRYTEAWDQLKFGLRKGTNPRGVATTTPKPTQFIRDLMKDRTTVVTTGSTRENAFNLAGTFLDAVVAKYQNTRLGRQELEAEILDDIPGALWTYALLDETRIHLDPNKTFKDIDQSDTRWVLRQLPQMQRIVVAIDPSGTKGELTDKTGNAANDVGIVVVGRGVDGHGYTLEDLTCNAGPAVWASIAVRAYHRWKADLIIAERNFGGAMVGHTIRSVDRYINFKEVTASRGKVVRAEPVASLFAQKRAHNVGVMTELETQLTQMTTTAYQGVGSPDRLDAMVWGYSELMLVNKIPPPAVNIRGSYRR